MIMLSKIVIPQMINNNKGSAPEDDVDDSASISNDDHNDSNERGCSAVGREERQSGISKAGARRRAEGERSHVGGVEGRSRSRQTTMLS